MFIEDQYRKRRGLFSEKRETGARPMKGAEYGGLCTVRQLRVDVYGHGASALWVGAGISGRVDLKRLVARTSSIACGIPIWCNSGRF